MKLRSVQALRGLAACAVLVMHAHIWAGKVSPTPLGVGAAGVDLFFVISGFIMANIARDKRPAEFLADRTVRVFPLWWLALVPWLLILDSSWLRIASSLALIPIYPVASVPLLEVGWTLSFELLFYAAVTLAMATRMAVPAAIFGIALVLAFATRSAPFVFLGSPIGLEFLLGALVATLPRRPALAVPLAPLALLWILYVPFTLTEPSDVFMPEVAALRVFAFGVPAALLLYAALSQEHNFRGKWFDGFVLLGNASYSIYLFHPIAMKLLAQHWIVEALAAIAFGILVHLAVEAPLMRWWSNRRAARRLRPPSSAPKPQFSA